MNKGGLRPDARIFDYNPAKKKSIRQSMTALQKAFAHARLPLPFFIGSRRCRFGRAHG
jgi:hypothetical protein